ncbi:hypothetical protein HDE_08376 [Halotydeus destructor]|nr:hypothetical protein HDE_08376 [Halotydeus destructor]
MVPSSSSGDQLDSSENANYEEAADRSEGPVNDGGVNGRVPVSPEDEQDRAKRWNAVLTNYGKYLEQEPSTLGSELSTVARKLALYRKEVLGQKRGERRLERGKLKATRAPLPVEL